MPPSDRTPQPAAVLAALTRTDATAPRLTFYDDGTGERIELSATTLSRWGAKAAGLLRDDADAGPGTSLGLDLPAHWRATYWAVAGWSVGALVLVGPSAGAADVVVTTDPALAASVVADGRYAVLVTLAALARSHPDTPAGVVDEARELASYPDRFHAPPPGGTEPAWRITDGGPEEAGDTAYGELVDPSRHSRGCRAVLPDRLAPMLREALDVWAVDGSVVLVHDGRDAQTDRLAAERVTLDLR